MIVIGIDCGTQSTKAIAVDCESGKVIASARQPHELIPDLAPGAMEQHPDDWIEAADFAITSVVNSLGSRRSGIAGIGVSGQQHGLVVLDDDGNVVRPAKLWCDTTTVAECRAITEAMGGTDTVIDAVGNAMLPGYTAPKIRWLADHEPDNWKKTGTILLPHDYLNFWLTGTARMEFGDASGTALMDIRSRKWSPLALNAVADGLPDRLPAVGSSLEPHGQLSPALSEKWGLQKNIVVSAGGGDNMMGAIGTGNVVPGVVTASLGTSGTLCACAGAPVVDAKGEVAGFCDSTDQWLPLVCTMNVTLVTEMTRELFGWDHAAFDAAVGSVAAGSDGLLLLPYLAGERTPNLPNGTGVFHGINTKNLTAPHLARAAMEGVTLGLGYGMDRFKQLGLAASEIRLTGGGSASSTWRQICADIFDVPVVCLETSEGAALGAAIQAAVHVTDRPLQDLTADWVRPDESTRVHPDPVSSETCRTLAKNAARLRETLLAGGLI